MTPGGKNVELAEKELRILVQSLQNCLSTCQKKANKPDSPCEDCDAAAALKRRLETLLP